MSNMSDLMTWLESRSVSPSHPGNQSYPPVKLKFAVFLDVYAIFRTFYLTPIPSRQVSSFFFFSMRIEVITLQVYGMECNCTCAADTASLFQGLR